MIVAQKPLDLCALKYVPLEYLTTNQKGRLNSDLRLGMGTIYCLLKKDSDSSD